MTPDPPSFWIRGSFEYLNALSKECKGRLAPLKRELKATRDPEVRKDLEKRIRAIQEELAKKRESGGRSLF